MTSPQLILGGVNLFLILFSAAWYWLAPALTRRDLLFGVTVAPNARATPAGRRIIRAYRLGIAAITVAALAALALALAFAPASWWQNGIASVAVLLIFVAYLIPYLLAYRASGALRAAPQAETGETAVREAELRSRRYGDYVPLFWELLPVAIIVATAVYLASLYPSAPAIIPTHWNLSGVPNGFATKSIASFFALVWVQLGLYVLFTGISLLVVRAKTPPGSASRRFLRLTLRFLVLFKSVILATLGIEAAVTSRAAVLGIAPPSSLVLIVLVPTLLMVLGFLILAVRVGQGGAKLENTPATQIDRMDDRYWLLGLLYVNRNDPSLLVQRRFGFGWTLNLGNLWSYVALTLVLAVPIGIVVVHLITRVH